MIIPVPELLAYALVFLRVGSIYFGLPLFGDTPTPIRIRVLLAVATTICLVPVLDIGTGIPLPSSIGATFLVVIKEVMVGLVIGFTARLVFDGIVMASSVVGYQMGFGTANLLVPDSDIQMNSFTALHRILVIMIFFALNMHHIYFHAISETFRIVPINMVQLHAEIGIFMRDVTANIFVTAVQLSAPVLVALMFTMAALGVIARAVPQMNVFVISFPLSFFIGLLIYAATLPLMPAWLQTQFETSGEHILTSIHGLRPLNP